MESAISWCGVERREGVCVWRPGHDCEISE